MKNTLSFLPILMLTLCLICCQSQTNTIPIVQEQHDSLSIEQTVQSVEEELELSDSSRFLSAVVNAYQVAKNNLKADSFYKAYDWLPADSSYTIKIELLIGKLFKTKQQIFLLRRHTYWTTHVDVYKVVDDTIKNIISNVIEYGSYVNDSIFDVNGDGYHDFLVHYYPASGCCRRNTYIVYLYIASKGKFSEGYEFINPTFSPQEGIIRGVEYGHSGEAGLYKYKWNGLAVDTIEYIYPDAATKGRFIKTTHSTYIHTDQEGIVLPAVPKEYHNIDDYDWFSFDLE